MPAPKTRTGPDPGGVTVNQKDLKRFKKMLEDKKKRALLNARKTLAEEATLDTDELSAASAAVTVPDCRAPFSER